MMKPSGTVVWPSGLVFAVFFGIRMHGSSPAYVLIGSPSKAGVQ